MREPEIAKIRAVKRVSYAATARKGKECSSGSVAVESLQSSAVAAVRKVQDPDTLVVKKVYLFWHLLLW